MAIRDLQQRLVKEEANSGVALFKKLEKELNAVYGDARGWRKHIGFNTEGTAGKWDVYDSYWEQAYQEILSEAKAAVKAKKSAKAKEVLGDIQSLAQDIAETEGITAPIGEAVQKMISVVQPYIEQRIVALKKGEGIISTMKKNAIASARSSVEGFVSGILAPLPFGAGDALIGKTKEMFGSNKERRSEQAMEFVSKVNENLEEEGGLETSSSEKSAKSKGGVVSAVSSAGDSAGEEGSFSLLENIDKNIQWIRDNSETAESRRERLREEDGGEVITVDGEKKEKDKKGLFGDFKFGDIFKKGGIKKLISTLGSTLFGGLTTAFGSTGVVGKSLISKLGPGLMKVAGPAALLAGIALAVKDGFAGYALSEEWGVSKFSGTLGGILGGEDKGLKGAMWGGMKWALIGAGIGSVFPVVGTVIGGALGALLGAILGYFGGEKIAQAIDDMGKWFDEKWNGFLSIFGLGDDKVTAEAEQQAGKDKLEIDKKQLGFVDQQITQLEGKDDLSEKQQEQLERLKAKKTTLETRVKKRKQVTGKGGSGLLKTAREKEIAELSASREETTGLFKGSVKGIEESEDDLAKAEEEHLEKMELLAKKEGQAYEGFDPYGTMVPLHKNHPKFDESVVRYVEAVEKMKTNALANIQEKRDAHQWMVDRLALLKSERRFDSEVESLRVGGFIAKSGIAEVHAGEEVLEAQEVYRIEQALNNSYGPALNQAAMERVGMGAGAAGRSGMKVIDQTQNIVNNHQNIFQSMNTRGQRLYGENRSIRGVPAIVGVHG